MDVLAAFKLSCFGEQQQIKGFRMVELKDVLNQARHG
jgi:hypothetical protein